MCNSKYNFQYQYYQTAIPVVFGSNCNISEEFLHYFQKMWKQFPQNLGRLCIGNCSHMSYKIPIVIVTILVNEVLLRIYNLSIK